MRDSTLPRRFSDSAGLTHMQWLKDGVHGVVFACGGHLRPTEWWNKRPRPVSCLFCLAGLRGPV